MGSSVSKRLMQKHSELVLALSDYLLCQSMGTLPFTGGLREQPHSVSLYFEILRSAEGEAQEQLRSKK